MSFGWGLEDVVFSLMAVAVWGLAVAVCVRLLAGVLERMKERERAEALAAEWAARTERDLGELKPGGPEPEAVEPGPAWSDEAVRVKRPGPGEG